jgi:hypothetical protein
LTLEQLAFLAQIIGTVAVVVSLIYVAVQIRQNNRHLAHEAQRTRAQSYRDNMGLMANNADIYIKDLNGQSLTPEEAFRLDRMWLGHLWGYQTSFQQLPRKEIEAGANFFCHEYANLPSFRAAWGANRDTLQPDFVQYMENEVFDA